MMQSQTSHPEKAEKKNNGMALTAGWMGIVGAIFYLAGLAVTLSSKGYSAFLPTIAWLACLAGLILGIIALAQLKKHPEEKGRGMAISGIVIGAVLLCAGPVTVISILSLAVH